MASQRPRPFRSHLAVPGVVVYWTQVEPAAWVDGKLCWRSDPQGEWTAYTAYELAHRYQDELKRAADAQATIAALQARVQELEEWKRIVTGAGNDQESVIRLAAHEYTKTAVQCWKEANAKLETQLTQRTAELEAVRVDSRTYINERHENMKQIEQLQAELERVRGELAETKEEVKCLDEQVSALNQGCLEYERLIAALPKVEGEIVTRQTPDGVDVTGYTEQGDFSPHIATFKEADHAERYVALLQHRQRMEG